MIRGKITDTYPKVSTQMNALKIVSILETLSHGCYIPLVFFLIYSWNPFTRLLYTFGFLPYLFLKPFHIAILFFWVSSLLHFYSILETLSHGCFILLVLTKAFRVKVQNLNYDFKKAYSRDITICIYFNLEKIIFN